MKNVKMSIQRQSKMAMAIPSLPEQNGDTVIVLQDAYRMAPCDTVVSSKGRETALAGQSIGMCSLHAGQWPR